MILVLMQRSVFYEPIQGLTVTSDIKFISQDKACTKQNEFNISKMTPATNLSLTG